MICNFFSPPILLTNYNIENGKNQPLSNLAICTYFETTIVAKLKYIVGKNVGKADVKPETRFLLKTTLHQCLQ